MADGDLAASRNLALVPATADVRQGYNHHNQTRDMIVMLVDAETAARVQAMEGMTPGGIGAVANDGAGQLRIGYIGNGRIRYVIPGYVGDTMIATVDDVNFRLSRGGDTMNGPLYLASAAPVTNSYVALYRNGDGRVGVSPSAAKFKKNIRDKTYTLDQLLRIRIVSYQLRAALFAEDYPQRANAPVDVGVIAEELIDAGLAEFVVFDEDGQPLSVHYERLALVAIGALQDLAHQLDGIAERLDALEDAR